MKFAENFLVKTKILGEDFSERMSRFGLIVENEAHNWDLSERDENALRTAEAVLNQQKTKIEIARQYLSNVKIVASNPAAVEKMVEDAIKALEDT